MKNANKLIKFTKKIDFRRHINIYVQFQNGLQTLLKVIAIIN